MTSGTPPDAERTPDRWADWLLRGRDRGKTDAQVRQTHRFLARIRNRVLRAAKIRAGDRVVDLGAGTGLLALAARRRVHGSGFVVALDVSPEALSECRRQAVPTSDRGRLHCLAGDALRLPLASESVDVVMTRSVLIYLADKPAGIHELYRVLKRGGRASIWEPINEMAEQAANRLRASGYYAPLEPEYGEIRQRYDAHKQDWWGALVGWDERDLIGWFEAAGFSSIKASYEFTAGIRQKAPTRADILAGLRGRPNPNMPSHEEVVRDVLGDRAEAYLDRYVRFLANAVGDRSASASIFLLARR